MKVCSRCSEYFANEATFCPLDGTELKKTHDPYLGRTIAGRYRIVKRLGGGGMSTVYLARHVMIDRLSAIKVLRQDLSLNPTHRERFLREARAVNRINHHNIIEISDVGEMDGVAYLVMEYVDGQSLHDALKPGAFAWQRAVPIAMQIAAALGRAHQLGVIHRDLKPENILLVRIPAGSDGGPESELVKLTDFGIAKILDAPALTYSEHLFGTPGYIAPEYVDGLPAEPRSDLYALGVLTYEMMTGTLPYDGRGADLLTAPLRSAPIPPGQRVAGLPPDLESLTLRMLARRPDDRPADAYAVHDAMADILRRFGGAARLPPAFLSTPPPPRRDDANTIVDEPRSAPPLAYATDVAPASRLTANLHGVQTSEIAHRWPSALADLERTIQSARQKGGKRARGAERAAEHVEYGRTLVISIERATRAASEAQGRVDRLEAKGRAFRGNLGHAIDTLGRERSRERANAAALQTRREALLETKPKDVPGADAVVWETAALAAEEDRIRTVEADLAFQITELQTQLDSQNQALEAELAVATGALEGALGALRHLTGEFVRTLDDAAATVLPPTR
jgi:serine/threonine protein kinase